MMIEDDEEGGSLGVLRGVAEIARYLGLSKEDTVTLIRCGALPGSQLGLTLRDFCSTKSALKFYFENLTNLDPATLKGIGLLTKASARKLNRRIKNVELTDKIHRLHKLAGLDDDAPQPDALQEADQ